MARILLLLGVLMLGTLPPVRSQEAKDAPKAAAERASDPEETARAPMDVRGSTGLLVFLAWMWLSILVLVWLLGWKIREVDRLREVGYFEAKPRG